jgi:hypothetical protein
MEPEDIRAVQATPPEGRTLSLWMGVLGPPTMFLGAIGTSYISAQWACGSGGGGLLRTVVPAAVVAIAACAVPAVRPPRTGETDRSHAQAFLQRVALWSCILFALAVVALAIPRLFLDPCAQY